MPWIIFVCHTQMDATAGEIFSVPQLYTVESPCKGTDMGPRDGSLVPRHNPVMVEYFWCGSNLAWL